MTGNIKVQGFKPFKPSAISWKRSIHDFCDTAIVKIPAIAMMKRDGNTYDKVETGMKFKAGMKVEIECGYDGKNVTRFKGFISRVNYSVPLELECEGYSYQLRNKKGISFSKKLCTAKEVLLKVIEGTDVILDPNMPVITMDSVVFKDFSGTEVLQYLKEHSLLTTYFNYNVLYCGLKLGQSKTTVKHRLNWNTIKDSELKFDPNRELSKVNIILERRGKDGTKHRVQTYPKGSEEKILKIRHIVDEDQRQDIANEKRRELLNKGYEGRITAFLFPVVEPGMTTQIDDVRYPERTGKYVIEKVEGEFSPNGGRQKISIGAYLAG